jgi:hypothetical protein
MKKMLLFFVIMLFGIIDSFPQATFTTGALEVAVNQYGRIRLFTPDAVRHLQRASILVGTSSTTVFDYQNDGDSQDPTALVTNPTLSDFEIYGSFNNLYSSLPPDVIVKLNAYGWNNGNYAIFKFNVKNNEANPITATIGLDIIPELNQTYGFDSIVYNSEANAIMFRRGDAVNMGIKLLSAPLVSLYSFEWFTGYTVDSNYWNWLNNGYIQSVYGSNTEDGPVTITAQAPVTLNPGESIDVFYSMALGSNETIMLEGIAAADVKYQSLFTSVNDPNAFPDKFFLGQNYPNPFNPTTKISYRLEKRGLVTLKVYDLIGNEVTTLINQEQSAGLHQVDFNASELSSGLYFYSIKANGFTQTKKMILIK